MPAFKDLGKAAGDLLDGKQKKHFAGIGKDGWFKVALDTKASNGTKFAFSSEAGGKASAGVVFTPFKGLKVQKAEVNSNGEYALEGEFTGVVDNTKFAMKMGTKPSGSTLDNKKKYVDEVGELSVNYDDKTVNANMAVDFLCGDAPKVSFDVTHSGLVDNLTLGGKGEYRTALDTGILGAKSLVLGGSDAKVFAWEAGAAYKVADANFALQYVHGKKSLTASYHQVLSSDLSVCTQVQGSTAGGAPTIECGAKYKFDADTNVFSKLEVGGKNLSIGVQQKISPALTLNMSSQVLDLAEPKFSGLKFGFAYKN